MPTHTHARTHTHTHTLTHTHTHTHTLAHTHILTHTRTQHTQQAGKQQEERPDVVSVSFELMQAFHSVVIVDANLHVLNKAQRRREAKCVPSQSVFGTINDANRFRKQTTFHYTTLTQGQQTTFPTHYTLTSGPQTTFPTLHLHQRLKQPSTTLHLHQSRRQSIVFWE